MKNREFVNPLHRPEDTGVAKAHGSLKSVESPPKTVAPVNEPPYNPNTVAQKKTRFTTNSSGYQQNPNNNGQVPPGGRGIKGYRNTIYKSDTAVFKEGGRTVKRDQAYGKVLVKTNHPNTNLNKIYSGTEKHK